MSNRRYPPAYLRYLRARLFNLGKPTFWLTAIFLAVMGILIQQYVSHPEQLGKQPDTQGTGTYADENDALTQEEKAIAADIDNLPSLLADEQPLITSPTSNNSQNNKDKTSSLKTNTKPDADNSKTSTSSNDANEQTPASVNKNIFLSQAENLLRFGATDNNQLLGYQPLNVSSPSTGGILNSSSGTPGLLNRSNNSQLPTPLSQSNNQILPGVNNNSSTLVNSGGQSLYGGSVQPYSGNFAPSQTFSPNTGLNSGLNYYGQPSVYRNSNNGQPTTQNSGVNPATGYTQTNPYNNFNNPQSVTGNSGLQTTTGYTPSSIYNSTQNPALPGVTGYPQTNPYNINNNQPGIYNSAFPGASTYIQPNTPNYQPNSSYNQRNYSNNFNNGQPLTNQNPPTSNYITGTSPVIGPYTIPNPATNTRFPSSYRNSILAQPTQMPQPIYQNNNSYPGQPVNGYPNNQNGYSYP